MHPGNDFLIGKKHNKITQAQNNEHIVDHIRQVGRMWEKVQAQGGKRKNILYGRCVQIELCRVWSGGHGIH